MPLEITKKTYDKLREYFAYVEKVFGHDNRWSINSYSYIFESDVQRFAYYLIAQDGILDEKERTYLNALIDNGEGKTDITYVDQNSGILPAEARIKFKTTPPRSFILCLWATNKFAEKGNINKAFGVIENLYKQIAIDILKIDGRTSMDNMQKVGNVINSLVKVSKESYDEFIENLGEMEKIPQEDESVSEMSKTQETEMPMEESTANVIEKVEEMPVEEAPAEVIPEMEMPTAEVPEVELPTAEVPVEEVPEEVMPEVEMPTAEI
ncbi:hypothetical protein SAMN05216249_11236, partial [Acetitomaculum ruminis DSM 5522]